MKCPVVTKWTGLVTLLAILALVAAGCAPAAVATPTPTKAPATTAPAATVAPAAATPTVAAKTEPTKPAATPTTAAAAKPTGAPIKLGLITVLIPSKIAVDMAVQDINAAGGVNGSPLEIVTEDSPFDPKQAVMRKAGINGALAAALA